MNTWPQTRAALLAGSLGGQVVHVDALDSDVWNAVAESTRQKQTPARIEWRDNFLGRTASASPAGLCISCGRMTWRAEHESDSDPRGAIGNRTAVGIEAEDYGMRGPTLPLCFHCSNTQNLLTYAEKVARSRWHPKAASLFPHIPPRTDP